MRLNRPSQNMMTYYSAFAMVFLSFALTMGTSLRSIALGIAIAGILLSPDARSHLRFSFSLPVSWIILCFSAFAIAACFWSPASVHVKLYMLEKYCRFIYIPVLAAGFTDRKIRYYSLHAYLIAMFIFCMLSFGRYEWETVKNLVHQDPGRLIYDHINTGYMTAFAVYLAAHFCIKAQKRADKILYFTLVTLFSIHVLIFNESRTGYCIFAILLLLFFVQFFTYKPLRYAIIAVTCALLLSTQYLKMHNINHGFRLVQKNLQDYQAGNKASSIGIRIQLHDYAKSLFLKHPILGSGTGGYNTHFTQESPVQSYNVINPNPHSQYWLIAADLGAVGIILFVLIVIYLFKMSFALDTTQAILQASLLAMVSDGFLETVLMKCAGIAYLFVTIVALCLGEFIAKYEYQVK